MLAGLSLRAVPAAAARSKRVDIHMQSDPVGSWVGFDPVGVWVAPGTTVRWALEANVHTTTAYHPRNGDRPLRIPERAVPWDSGYLVNPGDSFEITLDVEGVYDYFCAPHEIAGMVGRIVVGRPGGPGMLPFDYFRGDATKSHWQSVPVAARAALPGVDDIVRERVVRGVAPERQ